MTCACGQLATVAGRCRKCHCRKLTAEYRQRWNERHTELLREAYQLPTRTQLSKRLTELSESLGFHREYLIRMAGEMGFSVPHRQQPWTKSEDRLLAQWAGDVSVSWMARKLGRSLGSVRNRMNRLQLSAKVQTGLTVKDVAQAFGVTEHQVRVWEGRGFIERHGGVVPETSVRQFIHNCSHAYDLRRVDQTWFKGMVFGD